MNSELLAKIIERKATVGIIGMGYVGLPLAMEFASKGFYSFGFDIDESKVNSLNSGNSYIPDVPSKILQELLANQKFLATSDFSKLAQIDIVIICVPTPLRKNKDPDISYILTATEKICEYLHSQQLIVLESTTYPGTTNEILLPMLEKTGHILDIDFYLAFSPERIDPGNKQFQTSNITKVVGGVSKMSTEIATILYQTIIDRVHKVSDARVAETTKLLENTFRSVNIALVNEIAQLCYQLGIDSYEVIQSAATKPFGFMPFYPGPGIGGHCIPLDPQYLSWKARLHGFEARFIGLAEEINSHMPRHVVQLVQDGLNNKSKSIKGSKILILGVSYKRDIDDIRESPALTIIEQLLKKGAEIVYHDPFVPKIDFEKILLNNMLITDETLADIDCAVVVTDHSNVNYLKVVRQVPLIIDSRNITKKLNLSESDSNKIIRL